MSVVLVHTPDEAARGRRLFVEEAMELGRTTGACHELGMDRLLSRAHVRLERDGDSLRLIDANSHNGTFVNGARISSATVVDGDVVRIGATLMVVRRVERLFVQSRDEELEGWSAENSCAVERLAASGAHRHPVLFWGEAGTGKTLAANLLHRRFHANTAMVPLACGAIEPHEVAPLLRGSDDAPGLIEETALGVVVFENIEEAKVELVALLVELLEHAAVRRVGSRTRSPVAARLVFTSRKSPDELRSCISGSLVDRLARASAELAPLRRRREDIARLARRFAPDLDVLAVEALLRLPWLGNVRELERKLGRSPADAPTGLRVAADGTWFQRGAERVRVLPHRTAVRLLAALAKARRDGRMLDTTALVEVGWPGERLLPKAGAARVYVALSTLRKLGLRDAIERSMKGFRLAESASVVS